MTTINIDGTEYELEELPETTRANITSLKFVENELSRLKLTEAALQTARNAYSIAIKESLPDSGDDEGPSTTDGLGDTIRFD